MVTDHRIGMGCIEMKFNNNEEAVSPVIGVILMVAITVILAAVIAVFVFGMADNVQTNHNIVVTAKNVNSTAVMFTYQGGPDATILEKLNLTVFGPNGKPKGPETGSYTTSHDVLSDPSYSMFDSSSSSGTWKPKAIGETLTINGLPPKGHITVTGYFTDGTNQQILNKQI